MMNLSMIKNLTLYLTSSMDLEKRLYELARDYKEKFDEERYGNAIVICVSTIKILSSIIDPRLPGNKGELDELIKPENIMNVLNSENNDQLKSKFKTLDDGFNSKHKYVFDLVKILDDGSTIPHGIYLNSINTKDVEVNSEINKFLDTIQHMYNSEDPNGALSTIAALAIYSINAIRKSVYSHGIIENPNVMIMSKILDLDKIN